MICGRERLLLLLCREQALFAPLLRQVMRMVVLVALGSALAVPDAIAEGNLTGKDAAHIDWGVKNCEVTSTDKEHLMVEQANVRGRDKFIEQWAAESNKLVEATATASKREAMCTDIKGWYGPSGNRIAGLIIWKKDAPSDTKAKPGGQASAPRRGRRQPAQ